jgi:hypothetical protein
MRRGIVVVHGMGRHDRGDKLAEVVNPIVRVLQERGCDVDVDSDINYRANQKDQRPAKITLELKDLRDDEGNPQSQTWVFKEAYWDAVLPDVSHGDIIRWAWQSGLRMFTEVVAAIANPVYRGVGDRPNKHKAKQPPDSAVRINPLIELWWGLQSVALLFAYIVVMLLAPLIVFGAWLVHSIPFPPFLPSQFNVADMLEKALGGLIVSIGDLLQYVDNEVWASNIRGEFEEILAPMLAGSEPYDSVTIIAHSMGSAIAYDALSVNGGVGDKLECPIDRRLTLVTLGQAITRMTDMAESSRTNPAANGKFRWMIHPKVHCKNPQSNFYWLNIYASSDPATGRSLPDSFYDDAGLNTTDNDGSVKQRRVLNLETPTRDHSAYFRNRELVVPRLIRAINAGNHLKNNAQNLSEIKPDEITRRYNAVGIISFLRIVVAILLIAHTVLVYISVSWRTKPWELLSEIAPGVFEGFEKTLTDNFLNLNLLSAGQALVALFIGFVIVIGVYRAIRHWFWVDLK